MTIFILFSQQKTRGRVAGKQAWLHAAQIARPSRRALHRALHSVAHSYLRAACLLRRYIQRVSLHKVKFTPT